MSTDALPRELAARKILVVDDQPSILGVLEMALGDAGAEVLTASDGPAGLQLAAQTHPDLILLDLVMPGMDGWQVLDALGRSARTAAIPVVLETSTQDFSTFDRARKKGVAAFISKPFRLNEVVQTCRKILDGARPLQGRAAPEDGPPQVQVRDTAGDLLASGRLIDLDARGAQVEIPTPLAVGREVALHFEKGGQRVSLKAEVRWIGNVGNSYQHGLSLRK